MIRTSGREKIFKHFMSESDFELDHHRDLSYPRVEPHYHEFYEILYFVSGHMDYIIGDKIYHLQNDDLLFIPPNITHNPVFHDFDVPYERYVLWLSVPTMNQLLSIDQELMNVSRQPADTGSTSDAADLTGDFNSARYLLRYRTTSGGNFSTIFASLEETLAEQKVLCRAQVKAFLLHLLIEYKKAVLEESRMVQGGVRDNLLTDILHYIQNHLTEDLSLDTISRYFLIDKFNFSHMFNEKMSTSYYQYVLHQRLLMAKNLLMDDVPANKVCYACGFHDYSSFFRAFKKTYEVSPTQFKKVQTQIMKTV